MSSLAVIGIFCYKRPEKLKASIQALLTNPEAKYSTIVCFCDGSKNNLDKIGVDSTRSFIDQIKGFNQIIRVYRKNNIGLRENFKQGLEYLTENYKSFIIVEDDLVVSSNYLKFMNDALQFYERQNSVFCITGYCFPLKGMAGYPYDSVVYYRLCVYGWASWSDRVSKVNWDLEKISTQMTSSKDFKKRLNTEGLDLYRMLVKTINGQISTWDVLFQVHISENKLKVIYPIKSKTTNIGFDNESTHTFGYNYLKTQIDQSGQTSFNFCNHDVINPRLIRQLRKPYSLPQLGKRKIYNLLKKKLHF